MVVRDGLGPSEPTDEVVRGWWSALALPVARSLLVEASPGAAERLAALEALLVQPELGRVERGELEARARALGSSPPPLPSPLLGLLDHGPVLSPLTGGADDASQLPTGTELELPAQDRVTRKNLNEASEDSPLVHSFEKLHTLEEHHGGSKTQDGEDELSDHAEALRELELTEVVRSDERPRSLLKVDAMFETTAGEVEDGADARGIPYDEWDPKRRTFRPGWCHVEVDRPEVRADRGELRRWLASEREHVEAVRAELLRAVEARRPRPRQLDGPEVDEDAMVERHAALAAGTTPPERLYRSARRSSPSLSVLLLVDASLSTDGWVDGLRVLDVERDAALVLGEAIDGLVDELGVAAFSSHTRRHCRFTVLKGMREPWALARPRLFGLAADGYTRIGPALRHATTVLKRTGARRRLALVLTDGKPNDYDRYEGSYGIGDVQHAVLEAHAAQVHVHALAIDRTARSNLPRMFGPSGFTLVGRPRHLADAMAAVVSRMQR
jgi:nitric oxide reductase NorD protein